jgi:hypothetical protein
VVEGALRNALNPGQPLELLAVQRTETQGVAEPRFGGQEGGALLRFLVDTALLGRMPAPSIRVSKSPESG